MAQQGSNFANDPQKASEAGKKGAEQRQQDQSSGSSQGGQQGGSQNPGNFANDREKASEAGRKGGQSLRSGPGLIPGPTRFERRARCPVETNPATPINRNDRPNISRRATRIAASRKSKPNGGLGRRSTKQRKAARRAVPAEESPRIIRPHKRAAGLAEEHLRNVPSPSDPVPRRKQHRPESAAPHRNFRASSAFYKQHALGTNPVCVNPSRLARACMAKKLRFPKKKKKLWTALPKREVKKINRKRK
jgi:general stress protein YciG